MALPDDDKKPAYLLQDDVWVRFKCWDSAGIGRTGTFLVVDMMLRRLRGLDPKDVNGGRQAVNIKRIVAALRKERAGMVQSLAQYLFCYRCEDPDSDSTSLEVGGVLSGSMTDNAGCAPG